MFDSSEAHHLKKDEFLQNDDAFQFSGGYTWYIACQLVPDFDSEFQAILDVGESGQSPNRLQCFLDDELALCIRVTGGSECLAKIEASSKEAYLNRWISLGLYIASNADSTNLKISVNNNLNAEQFCEGGLVETIGAKMRVGNDLSGGRGCEMYLLGMAIFSEFVDGEKNEGVFGAMEQRWTNLKPS